MDHAFDRAVKRICEPVRSHLLALPDSVKQGASEVRLRVGQPLSVTVRGAPVFVMPGGRVNYGHSGGCHRVSRDELYESFRSLCEYSVHAHQREITGGFIPLEGGHRAGLVGTAVGGESEITNVRDISAINIRVARQATGCGRTIAEAFIAGPGSHIIAGPPGSGKTTLLREAVRLLSSGELGRYYNTAVVDERFEIGGAVDGRPQFDLGPCTDLLSGYPKAAGVLSALRSMSPHLIAFDEVGTRTECEAVAEGLNSGVRFLITMHIGSREELFRRPVSQSLLATGAFDSVFLLGEDKVPGQIKEVIKTYEYVDQSPWTHPDLCQLRTGGDEYVQFPRRAGSLP